MLKYKKHFQILFREEIIKFFANIRNFQNEKFDYFSTKIIFFSQLRQFSDQFLNFEDNIDTHLGGSYKLNLGFDNQIFVLW